MKLIANIDGASLGNPGASGIGVVLHDAQGKVLKEYCENIGIGTNNRAEYMALLKSIDLAEEFGATELVVRSDSLLVVSQMSGLFKIKNSDIRTFVKEAHKRLKGSRLKFRIVHVPRESNKVADRLSKRGAKLVEE